MITHKKLKAVAYCRVSTITQEEGRSLEFQIKKCQDYCEFSNYDLIEVIQDVESGGKDERQGFINLQEKVKEKEFDVLVVWESSRISRVTITMLNFVLELQKNNIHFISISQPELNTTTPTGMLFFTIQASLSEYERKQISVRVKSNKWARAKEGIWQGGKLPIGYMKDSKDKDKIIIDKENAEIVKSMFDYFISCRSLNDTAKLYNKHISSVRWILSNDFYIGKFRYGKKENNINTGKIILHEDYQYFKGKHPAIIDKETFKMASAILETRQRKVLTKVALLFTGLVRCTCGSKLYAHHNCNRQDYRCDGCGKSISAKKLEPVIINKLFEMSELDDLNNVNIDKELLEKKLNALKLNLKSCEKEKNRCKNMYIKGHLTEKELDKEMAEIINKSNYIKSEIKLTENILNEKTKNLETQNNIELLKEVLYNMDNTDVAELKHLFRLLIDHIDFLGRTPEIQIKIYLK